MKKCRLLLPFILFAFLHIWLTSCVAHSSFEVTPSNTNTKVSTYTRTYTVTPTHTITLTDTITPSLTNTSLPTMTYTKVNMGLSKYFACRSHNTDITTYIKISIQLPKDWENKTVQKDLIMWGPPNDNRVIIIACEKLDQEAKLTAEDILPSPKVLQFEGPALTKWNYDSCKMLFFQTTEKKSITFYYVIHRDMETIIFHSTMSTNYSQTEWEGLLDAAIYSIFIY
jgi:hypothetical protein